MRRLCAVIAGLALVCGLAPAPAQAAASLTPPPFKPPLFNLAPHRPPPALVFAYHGFQVDAAHGAPGVAPDKTVRLIKAQIDMVEHAGLKPELLALMRATPVLADPAKLGEATDYVPGKGVTIKVAKLAAKKPVLLGGLLRAYYQQRLATGPAAADIARFRTDAVNRHVWPKTALMLQSDPDYFALTSATYLFGAITREPYSRADLRQTQPAYYQWLAALYDDGRARR